MSATTDSLSPVAYPKAVILDGQLVAGCRHSTTRRQGKQPSQSFPWSRLLRHARLAYPRL